MLSFTDTPTLVISDYANFGITDDDWVYTSYVWNGGGFSTFVCDRVSEHVMPFGFSYNYHKVCLCNSQLIFLVIPFLLISLLIITTRLYDTELHTKAY